MKSVYYQEKEGDKVRCGICPHRCLIKECGVGVCKVRINKGGELFAINYGKITSMSLDPIEKKPLRNFYPGSNILSVGSIGCNFRCDFCQNWSISQSGGESLDIPEVPSENLVKRALELIPDGNIGIAFTYNEPAIWYEYVLDTAKKAKEAGLKVVLVSNGYFNDAPLLELLPFVDAMNIDLKAFNESFYTGICGGNIEDVKNTITKASQFAHIEISTLVIPGLNDNPKDISEMASWLSKISPDISLHFSRYHPSYKRTEPPPTSLGILERCQKEAQKYLKNVYLGNV